MENTVPLEIHGARGKVEVEGVLGLGAKVLLDGEPVRAVKGAYAIPLKGGATAQVKVRGLLPGFQTVTVDGTPALDMGAHVPKVARYTMFAPLLLLLSALLGTVIGTIGMLLAVVLFFMSVFVVKNPEMPAGLRVALPVINTVAAALVVLVFAGVLG
ncbi:hypothetical protein RN607_08235 [Demequina capsici]|uniref:Uncharacterized protein n=1 Tax=Demequina capsici TaxID=3075620 RepID=A0AA96J8H3_9MICO|nr:hypothetical protein [Demequina sp. PMTSA13]WNM26187.1 hypothetical protein RN607_08235 [Demequina sp. PMTSA13]